MRQTKPSTYDPRLSSDDIRAFKQLLRSTPGMPQAIQDARWLDDDHVRIWAGGPSRIGGVMIDLSRHDGVWRIDDTLHYIS